MKKRKEFERFLEQFRAQFGKLLPPVLIFSFAVGYPLLRLLPRSFRAESTDFVIFGAMAAAGASLYLFRFLEPKKSNLRRDDPDVRLLRATVLQQRRAIEDLASSDKSAIVAQLKDALKRDASEQFLLEVSQSVATRDKLLRWNQFATDSLRRIDGEIDSQGRRGTVNMIMGAFTAMAGVILLSWVVLGESKHATGLNDFLLAFIPRVSIVAIIEVFAYFFLRLYKSALSEIKYFQNEATNLEARLAALRVALDLDQPDLLAKVVSSLLLVERNPMLTTGASTLELEKEKLDANVVSLSLNQVLGIVKDTLVAAKGKEP